MKCKDTQIKLSEFIDNELGVKNSLIIEEHIDECKQCFHKAESIRKLKKHLISLDAPSLNKEFDIKLQERINNINARSRFSKFLPLAASLALIVPLVHYLTFQPPLNVQNKLVIELQSIGKTTFDDYENFHKWTQLGNSDEGLECGGSMSKKYCSGSLDLLYLPNI